MEIIEVNPERSLYVASDIDCWESVATREIGVVVDLDGRLDDVPADADRFLYIYYPFQDLELPDSEKLHAVARLVADLSRTRRVLVHCMMGYNRSCLVMGIALTYLGMSGPAALEHLRSVRPGALFNDVYADYLASLPAKDRLLR